MPAPTLTQLTPADPALLDRLRTVRAALGQRVVILTHHYQRPELVRLGDIRGDSFELSREAARVDAEIIVFCGVHFMAEAAAVLCRPDQAVVMPDWTAGCPMADMGPAGVVEQAWARIMNVLGNETEVLPLTYMNSAAAVKSFCGLRGGAVCTSSNAERAIGWALRERPRVLFVPDEHLGRNTAHALGLKDEDVVMYRPRQPDGGLTDEQIERARLILWQGYCHVHTHFKVEHVAAARAAHPGCRVVVHPECRREVVAVADGSGSTRYLVDEVARAAPGSCTVVGTELNLVTRLAEEHPDRTVVPLSPSVCTTMMRVEAEDLLHTLEHLDSVPRVTVAPDVAVGARAALDRMLVLP